MTALCMAVSAQGGRNYIGLIAFFAFIAAMIIVPLIVAHRSK
jgi:hypothetical protein